MIVLSYFFELWLSAPTAVAASVFLVFFLLYLFEPRGNFKKFMIAALLAALISYNLAALFVRLTGRLS
jgi:hypothetical protein